MQKMSDDEWLCEGEPQVEQRQARSNNGNHKKDRLFKLVHLACMTHITIFSGGYWFLRSHKCILSRIAVAPEI